MPYYLPGWQRPMAGERKRRTALAAQLTEADLTGESADADADLAVLEHSNIVTPPQAAQRSCGHNLHSRSNENFCNQVQLTPESIGSFGIERIAFYIT
jgi:hypothetical protein